MKNLGLVAALTALFTAACSSPASGPGGSDSTDITTAPMLGVPGGQDAADHECRVVLQSASRIPGNSGGYETNCVPGSSCWYVWEGVLDVSPDAVEVGATPVVLFQVGSDPTWRRVEAEPIESPEGQFLYGFRVDEHTVPDGMSMTSLMQTKLQLAAAIEMPDDSRLFDHNRNAGDFDNYVLDAGNSWSLEADASVCSRSVQHAAIHFKSDWSNQQQGALVAGGDVTIEYDLQRLPQCFGSTYQGSPSWSTTAHARFLPSGELVSGPVSEYVYDDVGFQVGQVGWTLPIPSDAQRVEFWFEAGGESCDVQWDSNFGDNFSFPVESARINATVGWAGDGGSVVSRGMCESSMVPGVPETIVLDSWAMTRAECLWVYIDVYAPGITDQPNEHPEWLEAQSVFSRDGAEADTTWLSFVGRVGNNYRYKWDLRDGNDFMYTPWDQIEYGFRFSVDGNTWFDSGQGYTVERGDDWCPATYWGTEKCPG